MSKKQIGAPPVGECSSGPAVENCASTNVEYFRKMEVSSNSPLSLYDNLSSGHTDDLGVAMFGIAAIGDAEPPDAT